jgi:hypothetical protein
MTKEEYCRSWCGGGDDEHQKKCMEYPCKEFIQEFGKEIVKSDWKNTSLAVQ